MPNGVIISSKVELLSSALQHLQRLEAEKQLLTEVSRGFFFVFFTSEETFITKEEEETN